MVKIFSHPFKVNIGLLYKNLMTKTLVDNPTLLKFCIFKAKFGR